MSLRPNPAQPWPEDLTWPGRQLISPRQRYLTLCHTVLLLNMGCRMELQWPLLWVRHLFIMKRSVMLIVEIPAGLIQFGNELGPYAISWARLLALAEMYAWEPSGTTEPHGEPLDDWVGGYNSNDGQYVAPEDAKAMGDALGKALDDIPDSGGNDKTMTYSQGEVTGAEVPRRQESSNVHFMRSCFFPSVFGK